MKTWIFAFSSEGSELWEMRAIKSESLGAAFENLILQLEEDDIHHLDVKIKYMGDYDEDSTQD